MPRKTSLPAALRVVGEREIDEDSRTVAEAFPATPATLAPADPLGSDILEILRKSHDRVAGEAHQATAVAGAALERADAALQRVGSSEQAIAEKAAAAERGMAAVAQRALTEIKSATDKRQFAAGMFRAASERLAGLATFAIERAPALLALGAGVWLWHGVLADPQPLQLVGLALFGGVVIAPAIWLSSRRA